MSGVRAVHVVKSYDAQGVTVDAVRDLSLDVGSGEFVAVMGPSGCGKSTLLHLLGGIAKPSAGRVIVDDVDLTELDDRELADVRRHKIGFVFQAYNLIPVLSVRENIALPLEIAGARRGEVSSRVDLVLAEVGIEDLGSKTPTRLSGGEQQRVAIARALVARPAVLLADEPTGNLDTSSALDVVRLFGDLHARGQTIVLVTHDHKVASAAPRVVHMRDGSIVREHAAGPQPLSPEALLRES